MLISYEMRESASTDLSGIVKEIIPLSGEVLVHFLKGKLLEQKKHL